MTDLIIDPEFRDLLPPLPDDKFSQLEENVLANGIREPLVLWQGILIDGHNRYEIAKRHNLPFSTIDYQFGDRNDVLLWIANNQFGRRDLTTYERSVLALKIKPVIAEKAKEKQGERTDILEKSPKSSPINTRQEVAKLAGVSDNTIAKVEKIEEKAAPEVKAAVKSGEISINAAYEGVKAGATTVEEVKQVKEKKKIPIQQNSGNNERYTPKEYIDAAREVLGVINLDPASSELANETVKAEKFYTSENDGLAQEWYGNIWLNPPYAKDLLPQFAEKLANSDFNQAIVLVHNATETKWFLKFISKASAVVFPTGRIDCKTPGENKNAPLQGSAIIYSGDNAEKFIEVFLKFGWCAYVRR